MGAPKGNKYALGNNGGRPTDYDPSMCDQVVKMGKKGYSIAQMAAEFDVSRPTIDNWADQHNEFFEALSRAKVQAQAWWEHQGMSGLSNREFNAPVWKKSMEARFRDDYTERKQLTVDGNLGDRFARAEERLKDAGS